MIIILLDFGEKAASCAESLGIESIVNRALARESHVSWDAENAQPGEKKTRLSVKAKLEGEQLLFYICLRLVFDR